MKKLKIISALALFMAVSFVSFGQMKQVPVSIITGSSVSANEVAVRVWFRSIDAIYGTPEHMYKTFPATLQSETPFLEEMKTMRTYKAIIELPFNDTEYNIEIIAEAGDKYEFRRFDGVRINEINFSFYTPPGGGGTNPPSLWDPEDGHQL